MTPNTDESTPERRGHATLLVNDQRIPVGGDTDLRMLIDQIAHAVMSGGEFVHVEGQHGREYDVLVTPTTQVLLRVDGVTGESLETDAPWASTTDLEY